MARSEEKTDWLGNKYVQHYDDNGNEIGHSEEKTDFLGDKYIQHYDDNGNEIGRSEWKQGWLGNNYTQHYDNRGNEAGYSEEKTDWLGNKYTQNYDKKGDEISRTEVREDWLGNKYRKTEEYPSRGSTSTPSSSNLNEDSCLAQAIAYVLIAAAVIWFVFSVAIPLALINMSVIALIAGLIKWEWNKYLFPLSILGAIYIILDYNNGWSTKALVSNVDFFSDFIPAFYYLNIATGLIAAYFLIRNFLNDKYGVAESEFSKRNLIAISSLLAIGGLIIGLQIYFDSHPQYAARLTGSTSQNSSINGNEQMYSGYWVLVSGGTHPITGKKLNNSLNIAFEGNKAKINYNDELSMYANYEIEARYDAGKIIGDFYGHKNNVKINLVKEDQISFTVDPYAEFEPIVNNIYTRRSPVAMPIDNLFKAWSKLDLTLYMEQWDSKAAQYSKKFSPRNYQDILKRRESLFGRLKSVQVISYNVFGLKKEGNDRASLNVQYSMEFNFKNGKKIRESDITEKYVLKYDDIKKRWLILENFDYIE